LPTTVERAEINRDLLTQTTQWVDRVAWVLALRAAYTQVNTTLLERMEEIERRWFHWAAAADSAEAWSSYIPKFLDSVTDAYSAVIEEYAVTASKRLGTAP
jgi:hypothetical protein